MLKLLSGDPGYLNKERLSELQRDIGEVERMLKSLIKSLENKHLNPRTLESRTPFSQLIGRRTLTLNYCLEFI